jgi:hypothetical protein
VPVPISFNDGSDTDAFRSFVSLLPHPDDRDSSSRRRSASAGSTADPTTPRTAVRDTGDPRDPDPAHPARRDPSVRASGSARPSGSGSDYSHPAEYWNTGAGGGSRREGPRDGGDRIGGHPLAIAAKGLSNAFRGGMDAGEEVEAHRLHAHLLRRAQAEEQALQPLRSRRSTSHSGHSSRTATAQRPHRNRTAQLVQQPPSTADIATAQHSGHSNHTAGVAATQRPHT